MTTKTQPRRFSFCEANGFRALIFDWDGVLLDSGRAYYLGYERVLEEAGIATSPREIYLREGQPTGQLLAHLFATRRIPVSEPRIRAMVDRRRQYQAAFGCDFFPGIWRLLSELRAAGYKLAMVTGSSRQSVEKVLTKELENSFDVVVTADSRNPTQSRSAWLSRRRVSSPDSVWWRRMRPLASRLRTPPDAERSRSVPRWLQTT
jgi:phosphoglycolate phosphatase-like HAD superfamily hydrolase